MQFIVAIKITLPADRDTLRQRYPLIYIQEYSLPQYLVIPICGVNDFSIE